ncbi:unnamed protein product [Cunninghamella echinulata]
MSNAIITFYSTLYSTKSIDNNGVHLNLSHVPDVALYIIIESSKLCEDVIINEIMDACLRSYKINSPSRDGIPYPVLYLIPKHPFNLIKHYMVSNFHPADNKFMLIFFQKK